MRHESDYEHGISIIDTQLFRTAFAASFLVREADEAVIIESGPVQAVPRVLAALAAQGLPRTAVSHVIVTHVHLDHAAGAGALLAELPNAKLVVHPRGARHMIDPSRLIEGATAVYGADTLAATFGIPTAVPAARVINAPEGYELTLGSRTLRFFDTPGHARHHAVIFDSRSRAFFAGDMFGIAYPELVGPRGPFVFPTTTPVQFEPEAMHRSIDRMMAERPERVYFTHYGLVPGPLEAVAGDLHRFVDAFVKVAREAAAAPDRHERIKEGIAALLLGELDRRGCSLSAERQRQALVTDLELNTQGLEVWLEHELA